MKKLLLSSIILILSYYPVHADRLSREESRNILLKGQVLGHYTDSFGGGLPKINKS